MSAGSPSSRTTSRRWRILLSLIAAFIGITAARACADEVRCGQCGASPEAMIARFGKPTEDTVGICGERSDSPFTCRKLGYSAKGLVLTREVHHLIFAKLPAFGSNWGLVLCMHTVRGNSVPELRKPCG